MNSGVPPTHESPPDKDGGVITSSRWGVGGGA